MSIENIDYNITPPISIPIDSEELSALELMGKITGKTNEVVDEVNEFTTKLKDKTDLYGDHKGTWQGLRPSQANESISALVDLHTTRLDEIAKRPTGTTTTILQDFLNSISDDSIVKFPSGDYTITDLLVLNSKNNVVLDLRGCTIRTTKHGFGVLELTNCKKVQVIGGHLIGTSNFPAQSITSGVIHNEKTDAGVIGWGNNRNSSNISGGAYNGGHLYNCGIGLLIHNGCEDIIAYGVRSEYFNFVGIAVGFSGDGNIPRSKNIKIVRCNTHYNFDAGIQILAVDGITVDNCDTTNNGHPSALPTDIDCNPGYGLTLRSATQSYDFPIDVVVQNCRSYDNKRKGLDAHSGQKFKFINNKIRNCNYGGIAVTVFNTSLIFDYVISGNEIEDCGKVHCVTGDYTFGILAEGDGTTNTTSVIENNKIINCGNITPSNGGFAVGIIVRGGSKKVNNNVMVNSGCKYGLLSEVTAIEVKNNNFKHDNRTNTTDFYIKIYKSGTNHNVVVVSNNIIDIIGACIQLQGIDSGIVTTNIFKYTTTGAYVGSATMRITEDNIGLEGIVYPSTVSRSFNVYPMYVSIANGEATITDRNGLYSSVTSDAQGIKITFNRTVKAVGSAFSFAYGGVTSDIVKIYERESTGAYIRIGLGTQATPDGVPLASVSNVSFNLYLFAQ